MLRHRVSSPFATVPPTLYVRRITLAVIPTGRRGLSRCELHELRLLIIRSLGLDRTILFHLQPPHIHLNTGLSPNCPLNSAGLAIPHDAERKDAGHLPEKAHAVTVARRVSSRKITLPPRRLNAQSRYIWIPYWAHDDTFAHYPIPNDDAGQQASELFATQCDCQLIPVSHEIAGTNYRVQPGTDGGRFGEVVE
jgi:hypothetical protein